MLTVHTFVCNPIAENSYVVHDETLEAIIVDCGCFEEAEWTDIKQYIEANQLVVKHLLNTHLHFDHALGNTFVHRDLGLTTEASAKDWALYEAMDMQLTAFLGSTSVLQFEGGWQVPLGRALADGDTIAFGHHTISVISTPGHTPGGLCLHIKDAEGDVLLSGDTLFQMSIGRTDLPGGNYHQLIDSIRRLFLLCTTTTSTPAHPVTVYPGHGPSTTLESEQKYNPYL